MLHDPADARRRHHGVVGGTAVLAFLALLGFHAGSSEGDPQLSPVRGVVGAPPAAAPQLVVPPGATLPPGAVPGERPFGRRRFGRRYGRPPGALPPGDEGFDPGGAVVPQLVAPGEAPS